MYICDYRWNVIFKTAFANGLSAILFHSLQQIKHNHMYNFQDFVGTTFQ